MRRRNNLALYNEVLTFKEMAKRALKRGEIEKARKYLQIALKNLEILEIRASDELMRQIWNSAKREIVDMLNNLEEYAEKMRTYEGTVQTRPTMVKFAQTSSKAKGKEKSKTIVKGKLKLPPECKPEIMLAEIPEINFSDVAGFEDVKKELRESIEWQLKYPDLLKKLKLNPLKGILMYGPPGTGKTYLIKAAAGEFNIPIIIADPASIMSKYVGESEKIVKSIFDCARKLAPCIVFVDEVDKVLPLQTFSSDAPKRVEAQFLQEMDGIRSGEGFIVVFATNEPWNISPALMRPGRIDRIIYVGPPDREVRKELFKIHLREVPLDPDVDFEKLADLTEPNEEGYYSSSGIAQICNEAKKILLRRWTSGDTSPLKMEEIIEAIRLVPRSISHKMLEQYKQWGLQYSSF